ncbi:Methionine--tRNA ligase [Dirofilaria immitis]
MKTARDRRMPAYRTAMLEVCQLQLKICSKLIEIASPSYPTLFGLTTFKPSTLKKLAGQSVLLNPCCSPCGLVGIFYRKKFFRLPIFLTLLGRMDSRSSYFDLKR